MLWIRSAEVMNCKDEGRVDGGGREEKTGSLVDGGAVDGGASLHASNGSCV